MILLLVIGFLCWSFQSVHAIDYDTTELDQLIENAHLIVHGEIIAVDSEFVDVKIHEIVKATFAEQRIRITKFENWTCAWRWSEYTLGQTVLFFLNKSELTGQWHPMGAGNEGEMPIEGGRVFYKSFGSKPFCENEKHELRDGDIYGCDFDLQQAIEGIPTLSRLFITAKRRGEGLGEELVRMMSQMLFEKEQIHEIQLYVFEFNTAARKCYEKVGFTIRQKETTYLKVEGEVWTRLKMKLTRKEFEMSQAELSEPSFK